jgi:hypothetical protein
MLDLMIEELRRARHTRNFMRPARLAYMLFARARIPYPVEEVAWPIINEEADRFERLKEDADRILGDRYQADHWRSAANAVLEQFDRLMDMDGILNGETRLMRVIADGRFGVSRNYLDEVRKYVRR